MVASVITPATCGAYEVLGFENHLNVYHAGKHGLPEERARGLMVFLNSTAVDVYFRSFSGHTQVNATDLKRFKYPSREVLLALGRWSKEQEANTGALTQEQIDARVATMSA